MNPAMADGFLCHLLGNVMCHTGPSASASATGLYRVLLNRIQYWMFSNIACLATPVHWQKAV